MGLFNVHPRHNVRVNTLSPGNIWTPLWEAGVKSLPDAQKQIDAGKILKCSAGDVLCVQLHLTRTHAQFLRDILTFLGADAQLLGRFGTIFEAGEACLFLAAEATFTTGSNLPLTGGAELNYGMKNRQNKSNTNIF